METKGVTEDFRERADTEFTIWDIRDKMGLIETAYEECDGLLTSAGMSTLGYEKQDYTMMLEHLNILIDYVLDAHAQAHDILDHPLYLAFVNGAAQTLGEIVLNDITTENTFGMEEYVQFTEIDNIYYTREIKDHLTMSDFLGLEEVNPGEGMPVLENIETIGYFKELFRADYEGMTEGDINTMMEAYLYGGEFVHESHHPFGNFISGILDVTIVKPLIECIIGKDLITGDKLTEFEQGMQFVDVLLGVLTLGQGTAAMKSADLTGKDAAKQLLKVWAVDAVSDTAAYTAGYVCDELGMPPGVTFIASLLTGCTVSLEVGKYVFRDGGKIVKQLDADEMLEYVRGKGGTAVLDNANYAQKTYSNTFSAEGRKIYSDLAGEPINTIDDLVNAINFGKVNVADLPVEYIVRDGNTLILNTRTSQVLTQAGISRSQWNAIDRTGEALFEELLTEQLSRNKLTAEGISTVRSSGGQ